MPVAPELTPGFSCNDLKPSPRVMNKLLLVIILAIFVGCGQPAYKNPHIVIYTALGEIEVELFPEKAPLTVAAFLSYVDSGFYTNSSFYRVVMLEGLSTAGNVGLVQGGIWQTNDKQHPNVPGIVHESTKQTGLSHTNGTISLARTTPGTANTEFFICIGDQTQFDYGSGGAGDSLGFAAFGTVFKGMTVVRQIQQQRQHGQSFDQKIIINKIVKL
ncbi:MAG: peptidyl-prolyl cis-trans isomerase PpiA precursor [Ferruginibacter sp.]|nr:peptidyl-prolyl cis-trans isomerase PpiA precursor [Ferruginibacter sp.]